MVSTFIVPDNNSQVVNSYFNIIDGDIDVMARISASFSPHENEPPAMNVIVDRGATFNGTTLTEHAAQVTSTIVAPSANPRIDRIVINRTTGAIQLLSGTESASPTPPSIPAGCLPIAQVNLDVTTTSITNDRIIDERVQGSFGSSGTSLLNIQRFTSDDTYTPTPGTTFIVVEALGGGAGGGGCAATGGGQVSVGGGGGAGSYGRAIFTSGFESISVTVGAGVSATSAGASGNAGNPSSFGSLLIVPGGKGGTAGTAVSPPTITWGSNVSDSPTGANLISGNGEGGYTGMGLGTAAVAGGRGGTSAFSAGSGGSLNGAPGSGNSSVPSGAGGGGACNLPNSAARAGGAGGAGLVIVYEYA